MRVSGSQEDRKYSSPPLHGTQVPREEMPRSFQGNMEGAGKGILPGKGNLPGKELREVLQQEGTRIPGWAPTCRVVDWGPSWVERILRSRTTRIHETRLWRCRASFGIRRVLVYWLHWDPCHRNLLA